MSYSMALLHSDGGHIVVYLPYVAPLRALFWGDDICRQLRAFQALASGYHCVALRADMPLRGFVKHALWVESLTRLAPAFMSIY